MPRSDLRDSRPLSCVLGSRVPELSLDLGVRRKKEGVRRAFGLVPGSPETARFCELAGDGNWSVSLSLCDVLISLLIDATLARRRAPDFGREEGTAASASASVGRVSDVSSADGRDSEASIISSTGSAAASCIETS